MSRTFTKYTLRGDFLSTNITEGFLLELSRLGPAVGYRVLRGRRKEIVKWGDLINTLKPTRPELGLAKPHFSFLTNSQIKSYPSD